MRICLLRHGETDWNSLGKLQGREDIPLNGKGIEQVKEAAEYLKRFNWKIIVTSPLSRAKTSAEIIAKEIGKIEIREEAGFIEKDYGKVSGMTLLERQKFFPDGKFAGIEPPDVLRNRTVNALLKYIKEFEGNDIVIVSHGAAINSILAYVSNNEIGTGKTTLKNACMSLLEKTDAGITILYCNKTAGELTANEESTTSP